MVIDKATDTEYKGSVRSLLGVDKDDDITLPSEDINDITIFDMAEIEILTVLPDTADLTDKRVRIAMVYIMAALLCPSMPARMEIEIKTIDSSWKKKPIDYKLREEQLLAQASSLLDPMIPEVSKESTLFKVAPSQRAVNEPHERLIRQHWYYINSNQEDKNKVY